MPLHYLPYAQMGLTCSLKESFDEAVDYHQRSVDLSVGDAKEQSLAYYYLASTLAKKGEVQEAIDAYGVSIELQPDFAKALSERAELLAKKGRLEEALELAQRRGRSRLKMTRLTGHLKSMISS